MFICKVLENSSNLSAKLVESHVIFENKNILYDLEFNILQDFVEEPYGIWYSNDGIWINEKIDGGKFVARKLSTKRWKFEKTLQHQVFGDTPKIESNYYIAEGMFEDSKISIYNKNSTCVKSLPIDGVTNLTSVNHLLYGRNENSLFCWEKDLVEKWNVIIEKKINSSNASLRTIFQFKNLIIINAGEDDTDVRGNFEINAYQYDTGELVWHQIVETSPNMSSLIDDKLYVCVNNRFRLIDALTGAIEIDEIFDYKSFDDQAGEIGGVYPVKQGLLCTNKKNSFIELRSADAKTILQTIRFPETYSYSGEQPPIEHEGKLYINLTHLVPIPFNFMKSGIAVLTPDTNAPALLEATLEERPPYTVEPARDDAGNNAHLVKMGGDDPKKIIRYAQVVLKEIAIKSGVTWGWEFEELDKNHAGKLFLEIDTKNLSGKSKEEWLEFFSVIKTRVDEELFRSKVAAGNGKNRHRVIISVI